MTTGTVKWFNPKKGYGFITYGETEEDQQEIFVHFSVVKTEADGFKTLYEGEVVNFEITEGEKGPQAADVTVVEESPRRNRNRM